MVYYAQGVLTHVSLPRVVWTGDTDLRSSQCPVHSVLVVHGHGPASLAGQELQWKRESGRLKREKEGEARRNDERMIEERGGEEGKRDRQRSEGKRRERKEKIRRGRVAEESRRWQIST